MGLNNMALTLEQLVASEVIEYYDSVAINIDATNNFYFTQAPYDLTLEDGNTYKAAGGLLSMSTIVDNAGFNIDKIQIGIAAVVEIKAGESALETIQTLEYIDKPVTIYRTFMSDFKVAYQMILFKGYIDVLSASYNSEGDTTQATIDVTSHWSDFDRVATRYTNAKSQQEFFPLDKGFDYAVNVQKEVTWRENG